MGAAILGTGGGLAGKWIDQKRQRKVDFDHFKKSIKAEVRATSLRNKDRAARTNARRSMLIAEMAGHDTSGYGYKRTPWFDEKLRGAEKA